MSADTSAEIDTLLDLARASFGRAVERGDLIGAAYYFKALKRLLARRIGCPRA